MKHLTDLNISSNEQRALSILAKTLDTKYNISEIMLFGSKARGDADAESDLDVLIICNKALTRQERHQITDEIFAINLEYGSNISSLVVDKENWEIGPLSVLPIHEEILKDGVLLAGDTQR